MEGKAHQPAAPQSLCNTWLDLVRENAPLRAHMPEGEFRITWLIGSTLGQISGVVDRWLFLRVQKMLETGELIRVSGPYVPDG
ncbi:hypothetical protein SDC9_23729 [bioreactor metagenome]|uniref:Uncharacterized protein n=1 Tax=bioreactor metagenome TaxID=1076179 RepID=A0A644UG76_9ZZZZ|nr:hypothetical protein [Desulfitobacterium hafniense]MEA5022589.1 hypothetical protein [Desulfitobacterium hafniense]